MRKIVKAKQRFVRRSTPSLDAAREELAGEPFKLELVDLKGTDADQDSVIMEVRRRRAHPLRQRARPHGERRVGRPVPGSAHPDHRVHPARSRCCAPRRPTGAATSTTPSSQRITGRRRSRRRRRTPTWSASRRPERRDHRRLGAELDLFELPRRDRLRAGDVPPQGRIIRKGLKDYSRQRHTEAGYEFVNTPHATKGELFQSRSPRLVPRGHVPGDAPSTRSAPRTARSSARASTTTSADERSDAQPDLPARGRSYRELPLRLFEFGRSTATRSPGWCTA